MRRGIILAGGNGTRLHPLTAAISKQLLPVYDKPMISHTVDRFREIGVTDILCIVAPRDYDAFKRILGPTISVEIQEEPKGIAEALLIAAVGDPVLLWLGDNLVIGPEVSEKLKLADRNYDGATLFLHKHKNPRSYGVAETKGGKILSIEEKPQNPKSSNIVTGIYFYDSSAYARVQKIKPSARGELEITDLNNSYLADGLLSYSTFGKSAQWLDMGTFDDLLLAGNLIRRQNIRK